MGTTRRAPKGDPLIAVGYIRVSTTEQHLGPEAQRAAIYMWAGKNGVRLVDVFEDKGVSGTRMPEKRPGMVKALAAIRQHRAGILVAQKRDRAGRGTATAVEAALEHVGAVLETTDGASDDKSTGGKLRRGVDDLFAAHERNLISERTIAALDIKRGKGERLGSIPFGYHAPDGLHVEQHPGEQAVIEAAVAFRARGFTQQRIADELAAMGFTSRGGGRLKQTQVGRMLQKNIKESTAA